MTEKQRKPYQTEQEKNDRIRVVEELEKAYSYVNMFRETFGFTHAIPGWDKRHHQLGDVFFWDYVYENVQALKEELFTVYFDSAYNETRKVAGSKPADVMKVTNNVLEVCELEALFHSDGSTLF